MPETKVSKHQDRKAPSLPEDCSFPARLKLMSNRLTDAERRAGDYFLNNPRAAYLSITEAVDDSSLGYGTIIRFCRKLGCAGFQEFKVLLARELGSSAFPAGKGKGDVVSEHARKTQSELLSTEKLIDRRTLLRVARALNEADRVLVAGVAGSAAPAVAFEYRLSRIGVHSSVECEGYTLGIRVASLGRGDAFFAVSFSGATKDILAAAEVAKSGGARVISLTNFLHAPLVALADLSLFSAADRDPFSCEVFSNISTDFVLDVLFSRLFGIREDAHTMVEKTFKAVSDRRI